MGRRTVRFRTTSTAVALVGAALLVAAAFLLVLVDRALTANVDGQARLRAVEVAALVRDGTLPATLEPVGDTMQVLRLLLALMVPLLILVVGVTTWRLVGRTLEPVEAIRRQVAEISAAALDRRVPEPTTADEVQRLARTMNAMLDRLDAAARRQRTFTSDASHELRSPLATIRANLEVALAARAPVDWPRLAREWLAEQARLEALVADLLVLARLDERAPPLSSLVDLDELVLSEARAIQARARVRVDVTAVSGGRVRGDPVQLRRVVANLLDNAERHAATSVRCAVTTSDHTVELMVTDDGSGIPDADRHRVFDRFVRLDESRDHRAGGAGLGLAIVREVVTAHGGTVEVSGATFAIHLPSDRR